jgi:hypothetical protein
MKDKACGKYLVIKEGIPEPVKYQGAGTILKVDG